MVVIRTTDLWLLWGEKRGDSRPPLVGQLKITGVELLYGGTSARNWLLLCPSSGVANRGHRLVVPTKDRPGEPERNALGQLGDDAEQPPNLRHGHREQVCWPPFSSSFTCRRVTSR